MITLFWGGGAPAFPTPAIETIGLGLGLGLGIAGVGIMGVGIAVCTHYSAAHMAYVVYVELLAFTYWHDNINCGMNIALIFLFRYCRWFREMSCQYFAE